MRNQLAILFLALMATLGSTWVSDTHGGEAPSVGGFKQPTLPGHTVRPDPKVQPGPQYLLQRIIELEKKVGDLQQEMQFLKTHRHHYIPTRLPSGCGWMSLNVFFYEIEHDPDFKTKCGLLVGSTTEHPGQATPKLTDTPTK